MSAPAQKPALWLILLLIGFPQLSETIFAPILPDISRYFLASASLSQATLSVYFLGFAAGVALWGILADSIGRRPVMLLGLSVYTLASLACYFTASIYTLLALRALQACGAAVGSIVTQTMVRDTYEDRKSRMQVFATISGALAFTPALGPFLGASLATLWSFKVVFLFLVFMGASLLGLSALGLQETLAKGQAAQSISTLQVFKLLMQDSRIWASAFIVAGFNGIIFGIYGEGPFIFIDGLGMSRAQYGWFGLLVASFSNLGSFLAKKLARRGVSPYGLIQRGLILVLACALCYLLPQILHFPQWPKGLKIVYLMLVMGSLFVGMVMALPCTLSEALADYQHCLGRAGALFGMLYYVLLSGIMGLLSLLHNGSLWTLAYFILAIGIVLMIVHWRLQSPIKE